MIPSLVLYLSLDLMLALSFQTMFIFLPFCMPCSFFCCCLKLDILYQNQGKQNNRVSVFVNMAKSCLYLWSPVAMGARDLKLSLALVSVPPDVRLSWSCCSESTCSSSNRNQGVCWGHVTWGETWEREASFTGLWSLGCDLYSFLLL